MEQSRLGLLKRKRKDIAASLDLVQGKVVIGLISQILLFQSKANDVKQGCDLCSVVDSLLAKPILMSEQVVQFSQSVNSYKMVN